MTHKELHTLLSKISLGLCAFGGLLALRKKMPGKALAFLLLSLPGLYHLFLEDEEEIFPCP